MRDHFEKIELDYLTMRLVELGMSEIETEEVRKQVIDIFLNKLSKALACQKQEFRKMVGGKRKEQKEEKTPIGPDAFFKRIGGIEEIKGYNQAIQDILKELE